MKGSGLRDKVEIKRTISVEGIESALQSTEGMDLDEFLKNTELTSMFRRAGLYLISVKLKAFENYIKNGLSSNLVSRLMGHRTSLYPVHALIRVHCLAIKRADLNPEDSGVKKVSFMFKAEKSVKNYLEKKQFVPKGEWYQVAVPELMRIMLNLHFGDKVEKLPADGLSCLFYIFNERNCYEVKKAVWNEITAEALTRSARVEARQTIKEVISKIKIKGKWWYDVRYKNKRRVFRVLKAEVQLNAPDLLRTFEFSETHDSDDDDEEDVD